MGGVWDETRILPEGWVQDSVELHVRDTGSGLGYGYQWWLTPWGNGQSSLAYTGRGYGGQLLFAVPEYDLVAVFTGWNIYETSSLNRNYALNSVVDAVIATDED